MHAHEIRGIYNVCYICTTGYNSGKDGKQPNVDDNKQHLTITAQPVPVSLDPPFLFPL